MITLYISLSELLKNVLKIKALVCAVKIYNKCLERNVQVIVLVLGCIGILIVLIHLYMSDIEKHTLFSVCEKGLLICLIVATIFYGVIPEIVMITHKKGYKIAQDLVNTSGKVYDENKHTVDIEIESVDQVNVVSVDNHYKMDDYYIVYYVRVDVEVPMGYLRNVPVIVEKIYLARIL